MNAKRLVCGFGIFALIPVAHGDLPDPTPPDLGLAFSVDPTSFGLLISPAVSQSSSIDWAPAPLYPEAGVSEFVYTPTAPLVQVDRESLFLFSSDAFRLTRFPDTPRDYARRRTNLIGWPPVRDLGSLAWLLSGMLSIGVWQGGRGVRLLHLAAEPGWYHAGCPAQVGQATPFDFGFGVRPLCCLEFVDERIPKHSIAIGFAAVEYLQRETRYFLPSSRPRSPPLTDSTIRARVPEKRSIRQARIRGGLLGSLAVRLEFLYV